MTSADIRQSFLDFFRSKQHTLVPSSSLMPDAPNLLFTNAGMNQFVPIFLGQRAPDVDRWAGAVPGLPTRAADTQKCIRAGGKHNDLEDVGLDTYHHTFFEMLGNWSFGDYFKREAISWAWELVTEIWKFPKDRLYATVYKPGPGDPSELDQEAWDIWADLFGKAGLDPRIHIVSGNKKDNFWMMGDTGPCGPCSELHVDLTPTGNTRGRLVNHGDARCIEIWNLVFIQFNANPDGSFSPLPACHVDTGMGFERVTSILQGTRNFTDFAHARISNYETDIFRPVFDVLERLSGRKYKSTLPATDVHPIAAGQSQVAVDIAFRVIADHIRTLSFAIADGIHPGNTDRHYVLRRILRRAVRYGRALGFHQPFFFKLVGVLADTMGDVFPEIRAKQEQVEQVIRTEEEAFNRTLDTGLELFVEIVSTAEAFRAAAVKHKPTIRKLKSICVSTPEHGADDLSAVHQDAIRLREDLRSLNRGLDEALPPDIRLLSSRMSEICAVMDSIASRPIGPHDPVDDRFQTIQQRIAQVERSISRLANEQATFWGEAAFLLYDTYGFPLDLTELMARERGWKVDVPVFQKLMEEQRDRARKAQKKEAIELSEIEVTVPTRFVGFDTLQTTARVVDVLPLKDRCAVILDISPFYAEMGGQVGDTGTLTIENRQWPIINTQKTGDAWLHLLPPTSNLQPPIAELPAAGSTVTLSVDAPRRRAIQRHHTVTHLLHWALHEVVGMDITQKGSYVGPEKLTFDFNSAPLTPQQVADIEQLVNEQILENAGVTWTEVPYADVRSRKDIMQFFGERYGDQVRVVQIGGSPSALDGYSMELCGGTHTRATGEIGLFRIVSENAIASGIRRIEALAGIEAYRKAGDELKLIQSIASRINSPVGELERKVESLLAQQKELERQLKGLARKQAAETARGLLARATTIGNVRAIIEHVGAVDADTLQSMVNELKSRFQGVILLASVSDGAVALIAAVTPELTARIQAGRIIQQIAPIVGGKGGGRPDNARGGGKNASAIDQALAKARSLLS